MVIVFTKCDWRSAGCADSMILAGLPRVSKHGTSQTQRLTHNKDGDMIQRRQLMGALAASPWLGALPASAQTYPDRAIKIIGPLPPGSPPDVLARLLAEGLAHHGLAHVLRARGAGDQHRHGRGDQQGGQLRDQAVADRQ